MTGGTLGRSKGYRLHAVLRGWATRGVAAWVSHGFKHSGVNGAARYASPGLPSRLHGAPIAVDASSGDRMRQVVFGVEVLGEGFGANGLGQRVLP